VLDTLALVLDTLALVLDTLALVLDILALAWDTLPILQLELGVIQPPALDMVPTQRQDPIHRTCSTKLTPELIQTDQVQAIWVEELASVTHNIRPHTHLA